MAIKAILFSILASAMLLAEAPPQSDGKKHKSAESEKGYSSADIQKGWAFGEDPDQQKPEEAVEAVAIKGKCDAVCLLTKMLVVQEKQLKEQTKIRQILEEQFDPKPHMIKKEDGTECIANSSADCFEFPLIAEAKRVPVMANYLKNPHDDEAVKKWKEWFAVYLNHNFDIGRAAEYDSAENGSNSFKTDFKRDGYDSAQGHYYVAKAEHNSKLLNAFGSRGLSVKILLGKTKDLDLYAMDQIAIFIMKHPMLPVELVFSDQQSAEIYRGGGRSISFIGKAFSQRNVSKRLGTATDFPETLQSTPAYSVSYKDMKRNRTKIIKSGKVEADKLSNDIVEWMIFEKIIDPAQLNDSRIWKDSSGFGEKFIKETYGKTLSGGGR